jgi:hypothetical protein
MAPSAAAVVRGHRRAAALNAPEREKPLLNSCSGPNGAYLSDKCEPGWRDHLLAAKGPTAIDGWQHESASYVFSGGKIS